MSHEDSTGIQPEIPKRLFKHKSSLIKKFFNEPVDALDLRLANAEENISLLPQDPFTDIKKEEEEQIYHQNKEHPLDYSEVQIESSWGHKDPLGERIIHERMTVIEEEDVQRVTLRAGPPGLHHQTSLRLLVNQHSPASSYYQENYLSREAGLRTYGNYGTTEHLKRPHHELSETPTKRLRREDQYDHIDNRISLAERTEKSVNPLYCERPTSYTETESYHLKASEIRSRGSVLSSCSGDSGAAWWQSRHPYNAVPFIGYRQRYDDVATTSRRRPVLCERDITSSKTVESQDKDKVEGLKQKAGGRNMSVIVRNTFARPQPGASSVEEATNPSPPRAEVKDFSKAGQSVDGHLKKLENLRSGFAYKMSQNSPPKLIPSSSAVSQNSLRISEFSGLRDSVVGHHVVKHGVSATVTSQDFHGSDSHDEKTQGRGDSSDDTARPQSPSLSDDSAPPPPTASEKIACARKRGRPRKHAPKLALPPLYVFIRNLLHNTGYNPDVIAWVDIKNGCFKVTNTVEFARTWGKMKSNRSEEMNYEKMSRAMRYHYGCERQGRKGHLAMVKEKRLYYKFGELARNWRSEEVREICLVGCSTHALCKNNLCLWTKE